MGDLRDPAGLRGTWQARACAMGLALATSVSTLLCLGEPGNGIGGIGTAGADARPDQGAGMPANTRQAPLLMLSTMVQAVPEQRTQPRARETGHAPGSPGSSPEWGSDASRMTPSGRGALPSAATIGAAASPDPMQAFLPQTSLDRGTIPRSAPALEAIANVALSGLPIRLRIYVGRDGTVADVKVLQASDQDADAVSRLLRVFLDTAFVPGMRNGIDVPSCLDIEVSPNPRPLT